MPTLVVHSEEDWRCPVEQAQRMYVALKRRGVPTELLLFPGEGHELSRSGRPRHRLARLDTCCAGGRGGCRPTGTGGTSTRRRWRPRKPSPTRRRPPSH